MLSVAHFTVISYPVNRPVSLVKFRPICSKAVNKTPERVAGIAVSKAASDQLPGALLPPAKPRLPGATVAVPLPNALPPVLAPAQAQSLPGHPAAVLAQNLRRAIGC